MDTENQNYVVSLAEGNILQVKKATDDQNGKCNKEFNVDKTILGSWLNNGWEVNSVIDTTNINVVNLNGCTVIGTTFLLCKFKLRELHLSNVGLKHIPLCLYSGVDNLEVLDLSHNEIANFDVEPRCHLSLRELALNNNQLTNLPEWILQLRAPNLERLDYSFNKIEDIKCIFNKYDFKLVSLRMQNCYLLDQDLSFFKNIKHLQCLDISNKENEHNRANRFEDLGTLFVKPKWKSMKILKLNNLSLAVIPNGIVWLESISELYLTNNYLSWLPTGMEYLVNLEVIDVSHNDLTYFPKGFFLLQYVRVLKAADNQLTDFEDITSMKHLEVLDLYNNRLEDFENFPSSIKFIDLELNYFESRNFKFNNGYSTRLEEYRVSLSKRLYGPCARPATYEWSSASSSASSSVTSLPDEMLHAEWDGDPETLEDWDELYPPNEGRHPDVTFSDDEWNGTCYPPSPEIFETEPNPDRLYNDEWMFCDAEEDAS